MRAASIGSSAATPGISMPAPSIIRHRLTQKPPRDTRRRIDDKRRLLLHRPRQAAGARPIRCEPSPAGNVSSQETAEYGTVISDLQMKELVHDDVILERPRLVGKIMRKGAPACRRTRRPLPRHALNTDLRRGYANSRRPLAHPLLKFVAASSHDLSERIRSPISTIRLPDTSRRRTL
jgi:hypothetical protein